MFVQLAQGFLLLTAFKNIPQMNLTMEGRREGGKEGREGSGVGFEFSGSFIVLTLPSCQALCCGHCLP